MFNVRVEYERVPIRHIAVQCPKCNNWFHGEEIVDDDCQLEYSSDISYATFKCPICEKRFGGIQHAHTPNIEQVRFPLIYEGCLQKKVTTVWE